MRELLRSPVIGALILVGGLFAAILWLRSDPLRVRVEREPSRLEQVVDGVLEPRRYVANFERFEAQAHAQMERIARAIETYRMANKKLPGSLEDLTETDGRNPHPYLATIPADPWGNPYEYRVRDRRRYEIRSDGEDEQPDTDDDLVHPGER